jgi:hypothetical protein
MVFQLVGEPRLQRFSSTFVQEHATIDQQRVVGDLLRPRVLEDVFGRANSWLLVDELR